MYLLTNNIYRKPMAIPVFSQMLFGIRGKWYRSVLVHTIPDSTYLWMFLLENWHPLWSNYASGFFHFSRSIYNAWYFWFTNSFPQVNFYSFAFIPLCTNSLSSPNATGLCSQITFIWSPQKVLISFPGTSCDIICLPSS